MEKKKKKKKIDTVVAKKYILPIVQQLYEKVNHNVFQTFSDFCIQMLQIYLLYLSY